MPKRLLIISPRFPPLNAADMQRVRMSLPYFGEFDYEAEVVTVAPDYSRMVRDELLCESVSSTVKVHQVKALDYKWTSRIGLGSLALRSLWFFRSKVSELLRTRHYDLIYFSTTEFPVCILGAYWKRLFGIPYVIDMQDPWHSDYYQDKPKHQRPKKYWFSYWLNKYLEPIAMKQVAGLISVSPAYVADLKSRYPGIAAIPASIIPFAAFPPDQDIASRHQDEFSPLLDPEKTNLVYIGRGGADMHEASALILSALAASQEIRSGIRAYFIGTSYAPSGQGEKTIFPLAIRFGVQDQVIEVTDRISYYHTLALLQQADALLIMGSNDPRYTASKIYPYILAGKPLLGIFHQESPAIPVLREYQAPYVLDYASPGAFHQAADFLKELAAGRIATPQYNQAAIEKYSARNMTRRQCALFDQVITQPL